MSDSLAWSAFKEGAADDTSRKRSSMFASSTPADTNPNAADTRAMLPPRPRKRTRMTFGSNRNNFFSSRLEQKFLVNKPCLAIVEGLVEVNGNENSAGAALSDYARQVFHNNCYDALPRRGRCLEIPFEMTQGVWIASFMQEQPGAGDASKRTNATTMKPLTLSSFEQLRESSKDLRNVRLLLRHVSHQKLGMLERGKTNDASTDLDISVLAPWWHRALDLKLQGVEHAKDDDDFSFLVGSLALVAVDELAAPCAHDVLLQSFVALEQHQLAHAAASSDEYVVPAIVPLTKIVDDDDANDKNNSACKSRNSTADTSPESDAAVVDACEQPPLGFASMLAATTHEYDYRIMIARQRQVCPTPASTGMNAATSQLVVGLDLVFGIVHDAKPSRESLDSTASSQPLTQNALDFHTLSFESAEDTTANSGNDEDVVKANARGTSILMRRHAGDQLAALTTLEQTANMETAANLTEIVGSSESQAGKPFVTKSVDASDENAHPSVDLDMQLARVKELIKPRKMDEYYGSRKKSLPLKPTDVQTKHRPNSLAGALFNAIKQKTKSKLNRKAASTKSMSEAKDESPVGQKKQRSALEQPSAKHSSLSLTMTVNATDLKNASSSMLTAPESICTATSAPDDIYTKEHGPMDQPKLATEAMSGIENILPDAGVADSQMLVTSVTTSTAHSLFELTCDGSTDSNDSSDSSKVSSVFATPRPSKRGKRNASLFDQTLTDANVSCHTLKQTQEPQLQIDQFDNAAGSFIGFSRNGQRPLNIAAGKSLKRLVPQADSLESRPTDLMTVSDERMLDLAMPTVNALPAPTIVPANRKSVLDARMTGTYKQAASRKDNGVAVLTLKQTLASAVAPVKTSTALNALHMNNDDSGRELTLRVASRKSRSVSDETLPGNRKLPCTVLASLTPHQTSLTTNRVSMSAGPARPVTQPNHEPGIRVEEFNLELERAFASMVDDSSDLGSISGEVANDTSGIAFQATRWATRFGLSPLSSPSRPHHNAHAPCSDDATFYSDIDEYMSAHGGSPAAKSSRVDDSVSVTSSLPTANDGNLEADNDNKAAITDESGRRAQANVTDEADSDYAFHDVFFGNMVAETDDGHQNSVTSWLVSVILVTLLLGFSWFRFLGFIE
ncbi:hypothetical protein MPSEU_000236900 [Mayamaea pseudoterrestris]|nr:hypothetical protein MPSEU_000236900 [Mayamaea pseudoterrestris]